MYILTRYVVWEVLKFFLAALAALTLMFTLGMGTKVGRELGLPPMLMLRIMPFMLPEMLGITIPVAMLYSVSSVYGRMTGSNEVVALKSLGISPMAVIWPVLVLAAFLSLGTVWMYEIAATWCRPRIEQIAAESIEDIVYSMLRKSHTYESEQFKITVKRVEGHKLIQPSITLKAMADRPEITLTAAEAELHTDWDARVLRIACRQGEVEVKGQMRMSFPDQQEYSVPLVMPAPRTDHRDWVATRNIPDLIAGLAWKLRQSEALIEASKALGLKPSQKDLDDIAEYREKILRLKTEPYRRWSNGFTCLCFALLGTPVAMLWRHADVLTNFFVCFAPILALYYPLLMLGDKLTTSGALWPISFWMGNVILAIPAIVLLRWIVRH